MKIRHILPLGCLAVVASGHAQDLDKEITIDRDIVPAQRAAARPVVFPGVVSPIVSPVNLSMVENDAATRITPGISPYEPAADNGAFPATPWRGYVDLGYFPTIDLGVSAGYAIIDKKSTKLNVWLQADNRNYKADKRFYENELKMKTFDIAGGFGFAQKFGKHNILRLSTDMAFSSWSMPEAYLFNDRKQYFGNLHEEKDKDLTNLRWHLNGEFSGKANDRLTYGVGAGVGLFRNQKQDIQWVGPEPDYYPLPINETSATFNANLRQHVSDNAAVDINAEGEFLHFSSFFTPAMMASHISNFIVTNPGSKTIGQIDFIPAAEYNAGRFYGKVGARLGLSINSGSSFHVAPDILIGVNPDSRFGAWLKLGGGVEANSLEEIFLRSRYADSRLSYDFSNVAFTGQLGLRVGPFHGASLTLTADYAAANDWLMPYQLTSNWTVYNLFAPAKIRSWKFGAKFDWQYRSLVAVALSYECNPGDDEDRAWLYWNDRARHVLGASVSITPISPLSIDLGITARIDRRQWIESSREIIQINNQDYILNGDFSGDSYDLGDQTNLWAGASWRFTPALTIFARFDNILNNRGALLFNLPGQGFTGLFGLGYKF